jgi:hypothetical protein
VHRLWRKITVEVLVEEPREQVEDDPCEELQRVANMVRNEAKICHRDIRDNARRAIDLSR